MPSYFHSVRNTPTETNASFDARPGARKRASCGDCSAPPNLPPHWWPTYRDMEMHLYKMMAGQLQSAEQQVALRPARARSPSAKSFAFPRIIDVLPRIETPARRSLHSRQRSRSVGRWPSFNDIRRLHAGRSGHECGLADNGRRVGSEPGTSLADAGSYMQVQRYPGQSPSADPPAPPPSVVEDSLVADQFVVIPCGAAEDEFADDRREFFITATKDETPSARQCEGQSMQTALVEASGTETTALERYSMVELSKRYVPHMYARIPSGKVAAYQQRAAFNPYRPVRVRHHETASPSVRFAYAKTTTPWSPISTMLLEHSIASARGERRDGVVYTTHSLTPGST